MRIDLHHTERTVESTLIRAAANAAAWATYLSLRTARAVVIHAPARLSSRLANRIGGLL